MIDRVKYVIRYIKTKIVHGKAVSIPFHSHLGAKTDFYTSTGGRIQLGESITTTDNVHLSALNDGKLCIGKHVFINRNCTIVCRKRIQIGDNCAFGPNVCIYDHDHLYDYNGLKSGYKMADVVIEDHCWIGAGCIILRGTHIGKSSVIGAGSVIKGNIPSGSLVTMNKTYTIKKIEE